MTHLHVSIPCRIVNSCLNVNQSVVYQLWLIKHYIDCSFGDLIKDVFLASIKNRKAVKITYRDNIQIFDVWTKHLFQRFFQPVSDNMFMCVNEVSRECQNQLLHTQQAHDVRMT